MRLEDAIKAGVSTPVAWVGVVEIYVLGFAAVLAARAPIILGGITAIAILAVEGRLQPVLQALESVDITSLRAGTPIPQELRTALLKLASPAVLGVLVSAVVAAFITWLVAQAFASAAGIHAIATTLRGPVETADPVTDGLHGARTSTLTFVGLAIARGSVIIGLPLVVVMGGSVLPTLPHSVLTIVTLFGAPLLYFALGFAEQAAVLENRPAGSALRASLSFVAREPGRFLGYLGVGALTLVVLAILGGMLGAGGQAAASALAFLVVGPLFFDTFKTALYLPAHTRTEDRHGTRSVSVSHGLRNLLQIPVTHPFSVGLGAALLAGGGVGGWALTSQLGLELLGPGGGPYHLDPTALGQIWLNNWLVATATTLGGFAIGVPAATNLLFNGALIGGVAGVVDPTAFLILIAPHGIIEIPAIILAGGTGLILGARGWAALRGRREIEDLAEDVHWAVEVLVGLGVVLFTAALIETFLTPVVAEYAIGLSLFG